MIKYLFLVNLYAILIYGLYQFLLAKKSNHQWSRWYLLLGLTASFSLPLIEVKWSNNLQALNPLKTTLLQELDDVLISSSNQAAWSWQSLILYAYIAIAAFLVLRFAFKLMQLRKAIKTGVILDCNKNYILVYQDKLPISSFMNYIFVPQKEPLEPLLLEHELVHVKQKHTWDVLFMELLSCFGFFNLSIFLFKKSLKIIHEYQADKVGEQSLQAYFDLLLCHQFQRPEMALTHSFSIHPLKLRMMMLHQKRTLSNAAKCMLIVCFVCLSSVGVWAQAQEKKQEKAKPTEKNEPYTTVHQYASTEFTVSDFLNQNLTFPKELRNKKFAHRIMVKFVIDENGKVDDPVVVRSVTKEGAPLTGDEANLLKNEALRVVSIMPDWNPGLIDGKTVSSYMTIPITFQNK